ncbi:MAG TPA: trypsin-like serine protease [Pseudonocardiaceae bacterium]
MNKFVNVAIVGSAALAVGLIPAAASAYAVTAPTPPPVTTVVAPPITTAPGHHTVPVPGSHTPGTHAPGAPGHGTPGRTHNPPRPPSHRTPSHRTPGHRAPSHHTPTPRTPSHRTPRPKPAPVHTARLALEPNIVGGTDATNAPWAAQVDWDGMGFQCSGTVVAPEWVLTAGHCANKGAMSVRVGSLQLDGGDQIAVDRAEADPSADLALLHLATATKVPAVQLGSEAPKAGAINQIFGWGMTAPGSGPAEALKVAKVKVTGTDCVDAAQGPAICSTGMTGAALNGDSGGPEMAGGNEVGVCSTGDEDAKTAQYTSVAANRPWLKQVAGV